MEPFIAQTDKRWFDFLSSRARDGVVDEVNFWSPQSTDPLKKMNEGEPVFFRLKKPHFAIAGYGYFAHFRVLDLETAWDLFEWKNGDPDRLGFLDRIGAFRKKDLLNPSTPRAPLGCTILRSAVFWSSERWIPWGETRGWAANIVRGKTEENSGHAHFLLNTMADAAPEELVASSFVPLEVDERRFVRSVQAAREGQGTFRTRLIDAYKGRCAITGEHTEPVLDAAHIQPYLGPRSNHLQNGLTLTKEFHTLFDRGYVTVTPDLVVRVSSRLRSDWKNGRRYYPYDGQALVQVPDRPANRPSPEALAWHNRRVFLGTGS
ncbi:MAG TPA: HNH endonuclease [Planctomycetota bacterium]